MPLTFNFYGMVTPFDIQLLWNAVVVVFSSFFLSSFFLSRISPARAPTCICRSMSLRVKAQYRVCVRGCLP